MWLAALYVSGREWLIPVVLCFGAALVLLLWSYLRSPGPRWVRVTGFTLKALGFALLLLCLLNPQWISQRARPGENLFLVLIDESRSMAVRARGENLSRGEQLLIALREPAWQNRLEESFQVRRYGSASQLLSRDRFEGIRFDGRTSGLNHALRTLRERYRGRPVAGILLASDGLPTDQPLEAADFATLPAVYPILFSAQEPERDLAIRRVTTSQTAFEDAPVTLQVEASSTGFNGRPVSAQVIEVPASNVASNAGGRQNIPAQVQKAVRDGGPIPFRFEIRPPASGTFFYEVRVSEESTGATNAQPGEATLENNRRMVVLHRGQGPYRILYVGGRPNWEFKFLNRALLGEPEIQLVGLIRVARREAKFDFKGRAGESSNPLFRGFDRKTEATERYDQPVMVRLNTRDEQELQGGFPRTTAELYGYHAIILDDVEADFFTRDQLTLLQQYVSERGGGLLMLGGPDAYQHGNYAHTPMAEMLPVYLDSQENHAPGAWKFSLTREGWLQPWVRLRPLEAEDQTRIAAMPAFQVLNRARQTKPGASVLATVKSADGTEFPALAAQRFGYGRVGALMIGDLWRWSLYEDKGDAAKAWRQTARWLVADVPERTAVAAIPATENPGGSSDLLTLQVRARDENFKPLENAQVTVLLQPRGFGLSNAPSLRLTAEASAMEPGLYEALYSPGTNEAFQITATVTNASGASAGWAENGWASAQDASELRELRPDNAFLQRLARQTGGEMVPLRSLAAFAEKLPDRAAPVSESVATPLWHRSLIFLLALVFLAGEWGLRRWKGLA